MPSHLSKKRKIKKQCRASDRPPRDVPSNGSCRQNTIWTVLTIIMCSSSVVLWMLTILRETDMHSAIIAVPSRRLGLTLNLSRKAANTTGFSKKFLQKSNDDITGIKPNNAGDSFAKSATRATTTIVSPKCEKHQGYANSRIEGGVEVTGIATPDDCEARCMKSYDCTCWAWKDDGFCKFGLAASCTLVGSEDDKHWWFGACPRSEHVVGVVAPLEQASNSGERPLVSDTGERVACKDGVACGVRDVHVFYYMWYGSKAFDDQWVHWNHIYIPHWNKMQAAKWKHGQHDPDKDDIGSSFWPELGLYSSRDPEVIRNHLRSMVRARIGVVVVSWYPPGLKDENGMFDHEDLLQMLLDLCIEYDLEVALHIEPYQNRSATSVKRDLQYIAERFGDHPALHKRIPTGRHRSWLRKDRQDVALPFVYMYDSYHTSPQEWARLLTPNGGITVRNTEYDAIVVCLWTMQKHSSYLEIGGFDGAYTYFAATGFTYGSTVKNWRSMASFAESVGAFFVPSVGPGYNDEQVRPWNKQNTHDREGGNYLKRMFKAAVAVKPEIVSLTSWNEWHEGTNIEPAVPHASLDRHYADYGAAGPNAYVNFVKALVEGWKALPATAQAGGGKTAQDLMESKPLETTTATTTMSSSDDFDLEEELSVA